MKYRLAKFVYALTGILLIVVGVNLLFPIRSQLPATPKTTTSDILVSVPVAVVPIALGVLCLFRSRHWSREASRKD
jgi:hypothetical protein